ncbi:inner membrane transporter RhtA [Haloactinospora alba]|uniref:Inner membrane transporter RhtA n=2 Tax=Haloactinospora alba TaxID=405555 RepID=A0A543NI77_9ACTN|nr:EamA family transporter [Haloactinospora alba]TQN31545.1 inner membrane transporter RhtA [Haloactinospora alba]
MPTFLPSSLFAAGNRIPAPVLLLLGMFSLQTGGALAVTLFGQVGALGVTWLRLSWAALILLLLSGPSLWRAVREATPRERASVVMLGTVSAGMMALYSEATARIDLGTATALEFLGPLVVAVLALRRRAELVWLLAAATGVLLLTRPWNGETDPVGILLGLTGATCVGLYIVLTQRVGGSFSAVHGLALAMTVAAGVTAPLGAPSVLAAPSWHILAATLGIAILFPVVPFLLEMVVLQRMNRTAYSTFVSLEPAVSLVMGMLIIAQTPLPMELVGMAAVVVAGIGAARGTARAHPYPRRTSGQRERRSADHVENAISVPRKRGSTTCDSSDPR